MEISQFNDFVKRAWDLFPRVRFTNRYTIDELEDLFIMATGLPGEVGEICEKLKKYVRDGEIDKQALMLEMGDTIYYWFRIAQRFQLEPQQILDAVVQKIESRRGRGTLNGSGDYR